MPLHTHDSEVVDNKAAKRKFKPHDRMNNKDRINAYRSSAEAISDLVNL